MEHCKECEFWNKTPDKCSQENPEQCNRILGSRMMDKDTLAYTSMEGVVLLTRPDFGCVMFKRWSGIHSVSFVG
jgi:hypothetical protein